MQKNKYIHFVGIKGVGMTPLALIAKEAGFTVTGSDVDQEFITDAVLTKVGIVPFKSFSPEHINQPDLVITTGAHGGFDNIEVTTAKDKSIPVMSAGEATGAFMQGEILGRTFVGISIAGTHGKTTTSAMVATMLQEAGEDPTYFIGTGDVGSLNGPGHLGKGKYFVAEADEYATEPKHDRSPRFLWQHPKYIVITNIEYDHPDIYESLEAVQKVFVQFANQVELGGALIACGDDPQVQQLVKVYTKKVITYGFGDASDYMLKDITFSDRKMSFVVGKKGQTLGMFVLGVVGEHNALNALAAIIVGCEIGIPIEKIKQGLLSFRGSKRRLEYIGTLVSGAMVYDDYAHHPTEIIKTLQTLRKQYATKKIICIFQPHTYSRTKLLFAEFQRAFNNIDELFVIIIDIYASLREQPDITVSAERLVTEMKIKQQNVHYLPSLSDVVQYINEKEFRSDTILVTLGAGDVYTIHASLPFV